MNAAIAIMALLAVAAVGFVPFDEADADSYTSITGTTHVLKVSGSGEYTIMYSDPDLLDVDDVSIAFSAKLVNHGGETQSSAVSPSSGELDNGTGKVIKVTAPSTTGEYKLQVSFAVKVGDDAREDKTETYSIKVVKPIVLTQTLKLSKDAKVDPSGLGVFFYIDGEKIADSYTTFDVSSQGTATVSYDWIADPAIGKHVFKVLPASGEDVSFITGLGEEKTFYVGDNSHTAMILISVLFVILMILVLVWIYRKPVKNFGKPKARR
ncbi:MAG: hypothetical protein II933_03285 [Candidatus Methanomethylophilaceae archaeon]|nr:hypothetical protein [Candidatus Methanomethylophilaceae archaeon]